MRNSFYLKQTKWGCVLGGGTTASLVVFYFEFREYYNNFKIPYII